MTVVRTLVSWVVAAPRLILMGLLRIYQFTISPLLGPRCKYYPSCSNYGLQSVRRYGAIKGFALAGWRVLRCNPWSNGGIDDVPAVGEPLFRRQAHHTSSGAQASVTSS